MYMGGLILGVNTLYRLLCIFKLFPMVCKGLKGHCHVGDCLDTSVYVHLAVHECWPRPLCTCMELTYVYTETL